MSESAGRGGRGLFIGRYFGIEFFLDYSWFVIASILTYSLAAEMFPLLLPGSAPAVHYALGGLAALLFFLSILLHELGHSLVSQRCGIPVPRITLMFIGGLAEIAKEPEDAKSELKIALGGPAVSLVLVGVFEGVSRLLEQRHEIGFAYLFSWLAQANLVLLIFNMFPGYPLDGGRVLRALIWAKTGRLRKATYITSRIGIGFSWLIAGLGVWEVVNRQWGGLVLVLIAMFLKNAAESGYQHALHREVLDGVTVADFMAREPISILEHLPINVTVDEYFLVYHHQAFPVCSVDGEFRGLLRLGAVKAIPHEKRPYTNAANIVAESGGESLSIDLHETATRALRRLQSPDQQRLAVLDAGRLVGMVTRSDLAQFIDIRIALEGAPKLGEEKNS